MLIGKLARSCKDFISQQFNNANLSAYYPNKDYERNYPG